MELAKGNSADAVASSCSSVVYGPDAMFGKGAASSVVVRVDGDSDSDADSMTEVKVVEPSSGGQNRSRLGSMRSTGSSSLRKKLSSRLQDRIRKNTVKMISTIDEETKDEDMETVLNQRLDEVDEENPSEAGDTTYDVAELGSKDSVYH